MKIKVTEATNFIRIFRLPDEFPSEYCFGGGHPTVFTIVDWFNPFSQQDFWSENVKEFDSTDSDYIKHIKELIEFIKGKTYFDSAYTYMALTDYGDVFLINPEKRAIELQEKLDAIKKDMKTGKVIEL